MKKVISLFLSLAMLLSIVSVVDFSAYASVETGKCGDNLTYSLDTSTGVLTISGTGKMNDYSSGPYGHSPFDNNSYIKSIIIENGVTSIGRYAFSGCKSLTSITIPDSVTSIGSMAFYYTAYYNDESNWNNGVLYISDCLININDDFDSTTDYIIKDGTRIIADSAFYNSENLISVTIPDSVTSIDESAFENCTRLASIDVEKDNSYYSSQDGVLFNKDKTELIQYPAGNKRTTYDIPNSVKSIGSSAFENCTSLASVTIPNSVKSIGSSAFENCTSLASVTIPNSVTSIGSSAFSGCSNLKSVNYNGTKAQWKSINGYSNIPIAIICTDGITGNGSVVTIDNLKYKIYDDTASLVSYTGSSKNFVIPESVTYEGLTFKVTSIGDYAFYNCTSLTNVTIPNSVESIGDNAFRDCSSLTNITIPDSVTNIGSIAFDGCTSLTSVTIPNSVTSISWHAFSGCGRLTGITIPNSVTSIGDYAFRNCTSLKSVNYSGTKSQWKAITIGSNNYDLTRAFIKCTDGFIGNGNTVTSDNLKYEIYDDTVSLVGYTDTPENLVISKNISYEGYTLNVTSIGESAFKGCTSLTSVTVPDSVTSIGDSAFSDCTSLTSITIPDSVTSIGSYAFEYCRSLTSITIPDSVTSIGSYAFEYCRSLTSVTIPNSVESIGDNAFQNCSSLTSATIGNNVTSIGSSAFFGCSKLKKIELPDSVTYIGSKAFDGTAFYNTVKNWEDGVLYCGNHLISAKSDVTKITVKASTVSIAAGALDNCKSLEKINVLNPKCVINCTIPKTAVIGGAEGSTAEDFAQKNNMSIDYFEECTHSDKVQVVIAATCTEQGAVQSRCADCDKLISQTFTAPLGHTMVITTPAKAPTCTTSGNTQAGYCTVCGYNEVSTVILATGHNFGNNSANCLVCGVANPNYVAPTQPTPSPTPSATPTQPNQNDTNTSNGEDVTVISKPKSASIKKLKAAKKAVSVEWKKVSGVKGYQVQVATDKKFKKNKKTVNIKKQKTTKTTVKKLKAKKKYYVRIRTYKIVNGKKVYSAWSKVKSVKTK